MWHEDSSYGVAVLTPAARGRQLVGLLGPLLLLVGVVLVRPALPVAVEACAINLALLSFGAVLGSAIGGRVDHVGHLVLLAWVASVVDVVSVFAPEGPTAMWRRRRRRQSVVKRAAPRRSTPRSSPRSSAAVDPSPRTRPPPAHTTRG